MVKILEPLLLATAFSLFMGALSSCGADGSTSATPGSQQAASGTPSLDFSSVAFAAGEAIPAQYTCDGDDISPPLRWGDPPTGTQNYALIVDDPDAPGGTWVHWVLYHVPAAARSLPEAVPPQAQLEDGSRHGRNSWKRADYGGPCPPRGTHRYFFKLYALDSPLDLEPGASKEQLLQAMDGHVLAQAELIGTYSR
jgi:Raf kinase inhibitor-like YbhB/YbcL family protein